MMDWKTTAQQLPVGHKVRIDCECGSGKTVIVNHLPKAYTAKCFRCDFTDYLEKGKLTLQELARLKELNKLALESKFELELPSDFTTEIPLEGRLWLYSGGISPTVWSKLGFGYSKHWERVVMPVYNNGELVWFQARAILKGQKPKYIQPSQDRSNIMFKMLKKSKERVVVVEDILSAIRVGKHENAVSLLGTKITTEQAAELSKYNKVTLWLDNDKAGRKGAYAIKKALSLVTDVDNIVTDEDPKRLSDKQIKELLWK
jgi:5S rRNA maturation endonuclease (ribonuclease M5)